MENFIFCAVLHLAEIHIRYRKMKNNHRGICLMLVTYIVMRILYVTLQVWDHPFSTCTNFCEKLIFFILICTRKKYCFSGKFWARTK